MQSRTSLDPRLPVFSSRSESETTKKEKVFQLSPFSTQTRGRIITSRHGLIHQYLLFINILPTFLYHIKEF